MATKAYLTEEEFEEGKRIFLAPSPLTPRERRMACSKWLAGKLEGRMSALDGWVEAKPVLLGRGLAASFARNPMLICYSPETKLPPRNWFPKHKAKESKSQPGSRRPLRLECRS